MQGNKAKIKVNNIIKKYGSDFLLGPIFAEFYASTITYIRGMNGAGKSTFISILANIQKPDSGEIENNNVINYVPQDIALYSSLSCRDNLMYWASIYGVKSKKEAIKKALDEVGLLPNEKKKVKNLSGGMKRRLNIAVALLRNCDVLILDEPLVGCDVESSSTIINLLRKKANEGVCVIIAAHNDEDMMKISNQVITLEKGQRVNE